MEEVELLIKLTESQNIKKEKFFSNRKNWRLKKYKKRKKISRVLRDTKK